MIKKIKTSSFISSFKNQSFKNFVPIIELNENEFKTVKELRQAELKEGDIVKTLGYYKPYDLGAATYQIMTYDEWLNTLPIEARIVSYGVNDLGYFPFRKLLVDNYGNHELENGLVAKLIIEDVVKVEQYGCIGDGVYNNNDALIHLFGQIKTGTIQFGKDKIYNIGATLYNEGHDKYLELGYTESQSNSCINNCYASIAGSWLGDRCRHHKPILFNVHDLILDGNNCTLFVPDNQWYVGKGQPMGIIDCVHSINNLEIKNFNIDGNGLNQVSYTKQDGTVGNMRTTNHGIFYSGSSFYDSKGLFESFTKYGINKDEIEPYWERPNQFSYINIHDNHFYRLGTGVVTGDCGGDAVLILPPEETTDVTFENNYVEDVGRWFFAVDLVHDYRDCTNYTIRNNVNTITDNNYILNGSGEKCYRGLGWIDFECTRRWVNLVIENNVTDSLPCFAMNGRYGDGIEPCDGIKILNNTMLRSGHRWYSAYDYDFYWYNANIKNLIFEGNTIKRGNPNLSSLGVGLENAKFISNKVIGSPLVIPGNLKGDFIFDSNVKCSFNSENELVVGRGALFELGTSNYDPNSVVSITYINNFGGIASRFAGGASSYISTSDLHMYDNITFTFENNEITQMNVVLSPYADVLFNPNQLKYEYWDDYTLSYGVMCIRGAKSSEPYLCVNTIPLHRWSSSGLLYEAGDIIARSDLERLECTKTGYLPVTKELFGQNSKDIKFSDVQGAAVKKDTSKFLYTTDHAYLIKTDGTLSTEAPTHTNGVELCGDVELEYLYPVATYKKRLNRESEQVAVITLDGDETYDYLSINDTFVSFCLTKATILNTFGYTLSTEATKYVFESDADFLTFNQNTNHNKDVEGFAVNGDAGQHLQVKFYSHRLNELSKNGLIEYLTNNPITFYIVKAQ